MRFVAYCMPLSRCLNVRLDLSDIILVILFVSFGKPLAVRRGNIELRVNSAIVWAFNALLFRIVMI